MKTLELVDIPAKLFGPYRELNPVVHDAVLDVSSRLSGLSILHINSTEKGGGVAELLKSEVAIERNLQLASDWLVVRPSTPQFFTITKKIHNLLQGAGGMLTTQELRLYQEESRRIADDLQAYLQHHSPDILIIHDPQPLLAGALVRTAARKALRLHIDLCIPAQSIMDVLCKDILAYNGVIVSRADCVPPCMPPEGPTIITPAIDPLTEKNIIMPKEHAREILSSYGIDPARPIISQVSRFDAWKDPLGVLRAYQIASQTIPGLQLLLIGIFQADDDPEAQETYNEVAAMAGQNPNIFLFSQESQLRGTSVDTFVNAAQTGSDIVLQKSIREGFGLTVAEAMWKGVAVIGGKAGGIELQITHETNGIIVDSIEQTSLQIIRLLSDDKLRDKLARAGRQSVEDQFLLPSYILRMLRFYESMQEQQSLDK